MAGRETVNKAIAQPLGKVPHIRGDWSARNRGTMLDAERYTRFVAIMKRALLVAAVAVILAVLFYSLQPRDTEHMAMTFERLGNVSNDLAMIKPKLTGTDSEGNPFVVTADSAVQLGRSSRRAKLYNVEADVTLKDGGWLNITATTGLLDATPSMLPKSGKKKKVATEHKGTLALTGAVSVYSDGGYELHSDLADIDLTTGKITGPHPVHGQGPLGTMRADRFEMIRSEAKKVPGKPAPTVQGHVTLTGHVYMTFNIGHGAKGNKKGSKKK